MNLGWPEVDFYRELIRAGGHPLILNPYQSPYRDYAFASWRRLMFDFADAFMPAQHRRVLFCESFHPAALYARSIAPMRPEVNDTIMVGLMHGGSFVPGDNLAQDRFIEASLLQAYDHTIVCVEYQKHIQDKRYPGLDSTVLPYPLHEAVGHLDQMPWNERKGVVFPHRQIPEKGYDLFMDLAPEFMDDVPWHSPSNLSKVDLFKLFGESRVVFANSEMELFGTAVEEALGMGCLAVLNTHPAYVERYHNQPYVFWHDGTLDSARLALIEALRVDEEHYNPYVYTPEDSQKRATDILDFVRSL